MNHFVNTLSDSRCSKIRKYISAILSFSLVFFVFSALAEIDLSEMTTDELVVLRDRINSELASRNEKSDITIVETSDYILSFSALEEGDKKAVNYYYDMCEPSSIERKESRYLILPFTIENKSGLLIDFCGLDEESINGWVVTGHIGLNKIPAGKKGKGFIYFDLEGSEMKTVNDFDSASFKIVTEYDEKRESRKKKSFTMIKTDDGYIINCSE